MRIVKCPSCKKIFEKYDVCREFKKPTKCDDCVQMDKKIRARKYYDKYLRKKIEAK